MSAQAAARTTRAMVLAHQPAAPLIRSRFRAMDSAQQPAPSIRVLLADDHAVVRQGIRDFLQAEPDIDVVAEAADGPTAQRLLEQLLPDVAILDVRMPGATGIEVVEWLRARNLPTRALVLTAFDDEPIATRALQVGAYGYLLKTADAEEIVEAVRSVAAGSIRLDPLIAQKLAVQALRGASSPHGAPSASPALPFGVEPLSDRERAVLVLAAAGLTNRAIGHQLTISDRTVQGHLANIFGKLQVGGRTEAVTRALHLGLIELPTGPAPGGWPGASS
jgi:DNA-binding NarL/FixJ family response regulator